MSSPAPVEPQPLDARLSDFSSRLSPIVVKELRQGMRTNLFVIAFILLQTFMILCMLAGLANPGSNDATGFFWFFIIATMMVIQPLRGFSALSSEYQLNTMDLIQLTRLNGWRITFGKWAALNAQGLLFLVGVLPYLVIRYFVGNVNLVYDFSAILTIGVASALATAITIGVSVFRSIVLRGILLVVLLILGIVAINLFNYSVLGRSGGITPDLANGLLYAVASVFGIFFFLSFGASRIAPLSENQATRKRLIAIGSALLCQAFHLLGNSEEAIAVTGVILGLACIDALTEPLPIFSSIAIPFRRSPILRILGIFLSPGWCSGIFFFLLCSGIWVGSILLWDLTASAKFFTNFEGPVLFLSLCNLIIFPLLILHLFFAKHSSHHFTFGLYIFTQASLFGITLMATVIANALGKWEDYVYLFVPLPSVFIAGNAGGSEADEAIHFWIAVSTFFVCVCFPLLRQHRSARAFFSTLWQNSD
ncbi:MAG: hypothetical protein P1U87_03555 [Verrucomicrobiales bacterium]|nr:hypothetical protein [Verrucomicrobiales bacterium]